MKKILLLCATLLVFAAGTRGQEWIATTTSKGLKGPVRSMHWIVVDSSTCKWHGCVQDPPTLIESMYWVFSPDGLLLEASSHNSRNGEAMSESWHYDKKRRPTQVLQMWADRAVCWEFRYDGNRVRSYTVYSDDSDDDTVIYRCDYDRKGHLLSVTEEGEHACPNVDLYTDGFLAEINNGTWHVVFVRNGRGELLKDSTYNIESDFDEHGEWKCWPRDTAIETNEYFYTPNGDLAEIHEVEYGKKGVTTYRYLEYDSYGNWTRRKVLYLRDNENVVCDEIRLLIYYKETQ